MRDAEAQRIRDTGYTSQYGADRLAVAAPFTTADPPLAAIELALPAEAPVGDVSRVAMAAAAAAEIRSAAC